MADLKIIHVDDNSLRKQFVNLPWHVFPSDSNYVPYLKMDFARLIDPRRHPFWEFSVQSLYIASRNGIPVGRIAAMIDRRYNAHHNQKMGIWGFFDCLNDEEAAAGLFSAAETWIKSHGMEFIRGPLNPSTNYEVGLLVEGFENLPALMMPWNFPYYLKLVEANGYSKEKDLVSMRINKTDPLSPKIQRLATRVRKKTNVTVRPFSKKNFHSDLRLLVDIYHDAWGENWGFVPMSDNEIVEMAKNLKRAMETEMIFFVEYEQEPVGVGLALPDYNPLLKELNGRITLSGLFKYLFRRKYVRGARALMGGIKKKVRNLGLPVIIFDYLDHLLRRDDRIDYVEMGWNLEDNDAINKFELAMGAHLRSRYRIFRKNLV